MKPVPDHIVASGPPGTVWFGGAVDCSTLALRVMSKDRGDGVDKDEVTRLLCCECNRDKTPNWSLAAPEQEPADLDAQVDWILSRVTPDLSVWKKITEGYRVDLFCGLFLERPNRGVTLTPKTMTDLGVRGIKLGFDIYAPETEPNVSLEPSAVDTDSFATRPTSSVGGGSLHNR